MSDEVVRATFDYSALNPEICSFVQQKTENIRVRLKRSAEDIIAIGQDLIEVKDCLPNMKFSSWLRAEFDMTRQTAYRFMSVAKKFGGCNIMLQLPPTVLYQLLDTPEAVIEMVESGQLEPTLPAIREAKQEILQAEVKEILAVTPFVSPEVPTYIPLTPEQESRREQKRIEIQARNEELRTKGATLPVGKYACLVVDPPWPIQWIDRDERPNQVGFDYPTMSEDELKAFPLPDIAGDDCHLYLWTTQKCLPMALRLAEHWGFKYQCQLTWVKNVGFTPYSWMYSTEHVLFCKKGNLPLLRLGKRLDFQAKVREHSRKPDEFYDLVKEVSPSPRLDVFSREKRDGFDQYGNEVDRFDCTSAG